MSKTKQHFPLEIPEVTGEFLSALEAVVGVLETSPVDSDDYNKALEWANKNWDDVQNWAVAIDISQLKSVHEEDRQLATRWLTAFNEVVARQSTSVFEELDDILDTEDDEEREAKWEAFFGEPISDEVEIPDDDDDEDEEN